MSDSQTTYNKRAYRHGKGDHSMCNPDRCIALGGNGRRDAAPVFVRNDPPRMPNIPARVSSIEAGEPIVRKITDGKISIRDKYGLGDVGVQFYREMMKEWQWDVACKKMLIEACRILDRLEYINEELQYADWRENFPARILSLSKDLAIAFKTIVTELYKQRDSAQQSNGQQPTGTVNDVASLRRKFEATT